MGKPDVLSYRRTHRKLRGAVSRMALTALLGSWITGAVFPEGLYAQETETTHEIKAQEVKAEQIREVKSVQMASNPAVIREGAAYLLNFEAGTLQNGIYNDGSSNALRFSGNTENVTLNSGQLSVGPVTASTVGAFDYGFTANPTRKFENFEVSFDLTVTQREASKQMGIQFQKNAWNDGWDAQLKAHVTYDGKLNLFEGPASIANTDGGKYRGIKEYGVPGLNRDVLPWETFRIKLVADGQRVRIYLNGASNPVVDVQRTAEVNPGFVGVFANAGTGFKMDNLLFNSLKPAAERDDFGLTGDTDGFYVYVPTIIESVYKYNIRYQNVTDGTYGQLHPYTGLADKYVHISGLTAGKDYRVELYPVYTSDRTHVDTEMTMFKSKTVHVGQPLQAQLTLTEGGSFYTAAKTVDLSVIGADRIRYTLDGSEPGLSHGTEISGDFIFGDSITIQQSATLKAAAILNGSVVSRSEAVYTAGVSPVTLTASRVFRASQSVTMGSIYADALVYTTDGSDPVYQASSNTAANGTMVNGATASLSVTQSTYLKALAVRSGVAGAIASARYTRVALNSSLITSWDFTHDGLLHAEEQDELYGKTSAPWSNLLGWDVNADKGVWANHIVTANVYRDLEGVHMFTTPEPIQAATSNPNVYLDTYDAGLQPIPSEYRYVSIWMKVNHTANAAIYYATDTEADTNQLSEVRKVAFRNTANETPEFQHYIVDMGSSPGWTGNITKLRIDPMATYPSMKDGIEMAIREISLLRKQDLPAEVRLTKFETSDKEIVRPGDTFEIRAELENIGHDTGTLALELQVPDFIELTPVSSTLSGAMSTGQKAVVTYHALVRGTGAGGISLSINSGGIPAVHGLSRIFSVHASLPASGQPDDVIIGTAGIRIVFPAPAHTGLPGYGFGWLEADKAGSWQRIAVMPSLGSVQQIVYGKTIQIKELYANAPALATPSSFMIGYQDPDGGEWTGSVTVADNVYGNLEMTHALSADRRRSIAAIAGPTLLAGEAGIPSLDPQQKVITANSNPANGYIDEALFPGLEWLDAKPLNNRSSDTDAVIQNPDGYRYVPHPRKITVPLMAMRKGDTLFGMMWDARKPWSGNHDQPSAFFGLPNRLERGEGTVSAKMSLFIPSVLDGVNENATFATGVPSFFANISANSNNENPVRQAYELQSGEEIELNSRIFVRQGTELSLLIDAWVQEYGLPQPLEYAHGTIEQESEAILTSFENLWLPEQGKWMNRIGPSASPIITSAFVMPYALLGPHGSRSFQTLAEQRIQTAKQGIGTNYSTYGYILPFYMDGIAAQTMEALQQTNVDSLTAIAKRVNPLSVTAGVYWDYQTFIARKGFPTSPYMGQLTDVTAGSNVEILYKMLRHARLTGNTSARTYGLAGIDYINANYKMPRGSQSWELRNMIPELETASMAVRANVEAYAITGSTGYLVQAKLWASRGMPFVYLWDDGSYGIDKSNGRGDFFGSHTFMRYGAIAAFGQSIYRTDGKPLPGTWFGRPVQWSGHDYGIALMELASALQRESLWEQHLLAGGTDYLTIAKGLSVSGSRQTTSADNRYPTHLYDAASLIKWETSDYLLPNYQGAELLGDLLGSLANPITKKVEIGTKEVRISAPAEFEVVSAQSTHIKLLASFNGPGEYTVLLQGVSGMSNVIIGSLDNQAIKISHQIRPTSGLAEVHLKVTGEGTVETEVEFTDVVLQ
ncbi:chitobiase/beta-hexosaminidase C-terminal domain-containing protein [Paenibacillus sp. WQ 127069]|uniref:Chitobiase/beta-hexosaminidase C-terminal domain-containing protein n=1 Tax=Paenibacillus baimaensis TaxID=2982185 RepID=A0ABT2UQJ7_9BACL|nr:chitobiase/beta-hexosaminidase C-terminal domain-containing protein [Paenibacillus sp. WQ 127069]MCU6796301.1 chitobiase/beta-hexosaminidase C-terminal domain-containing protein [Paenibacillus sp. WQ 127069]